MNSNITLENLVSYSVVIYYILMSLSSSHGKIHNYTEEYFGSKIPSKLSPSCLQTTAASELSQWLSHTVPRRDVKRFCTTSRYAYLCIYACSISILCCEHWLLSPSDTLATVLINMYIYTLLNHFTVHSQ